MYCCVPKELRRKKNMPLPYLLKAIDFLLTSEKDDLQLHFFGAEPLLLQYEVYARAFKYAYEKSRVSNKNLKVIVTTNGALFNKRWIDLFKKYDIYLEISLDGAPDSHNINRPQRNRGNSYHKIIRHLSSLFAAGINVQVSMVITPGTANKINENFLHLANLGFKKIFMMVANCVQWPERSLASLKNELRKVEASFPGISRTHSLTLLNLKDWVKPMRMNTELAVDVDGSIYSACVGYLAKDPDVKKLWTLANIRYVKGSIDDYEPSRLDNKTGMDIVFKETNAYDTLSSCIKAGNIMANFVSRLKKGRIHWPTE
jgi:sulfatase maturation enzyme AslB (radical SAM superfamily)